MVLIWILNFDSKDSFFFLYKRNSFIQWEEISIEVGVTINQPFSFLHNLFFHIIFYTTFQCFSTTFWIAFATFHTPGFIERAYLFILLC